MAIINIDTSKLSDTGYREYLASLLSDAEAKQPKRVNIGQAIIDEGDVPVVLGEVHGYCNPYRVEDIPKLEIQRGSLTFYLVPSRAGCFQVTHETGGDYGASPVIGLKHVLDLTCSGRGAGYQSNCNKEEIIEALLYGQAMIALQNFCSYGGKKSTIEVGKRYRKMYSEYASSLACFIRYTYNWLWSAVR